MPASSEAPKVVVTTIPKSGTHLLDSILERMPPMRRVKKIGLSANLRLHPYNLLPFGERCQVGIGRPRTVHTAALRQRLNQIKPGTYGLGYVPYSETAKRLIDRAHIVPVVAIRDPRAIVVSLMHHSMSESDHFLHDRLQGMASDEERLAALISGVESTKGELRRGIAHQIDLILGWVEDPDVLTVRFEDLVGEAGGGDSAVQASAIKGLGDHIGIALTLEEAAAIGRDMFGKGKTFRKGSIDAWKEALGPELLTLLDGKIGDRLAKLGYHG